MGVGELYRTRKHKVRVMKLANTLVKPLVHCMAIPRNNSSIGLTIPSLICRRYEAKMEYDPVQYWRCYYLHSKAPGWVQWWIRQRTSISRGATFLVPSKTTPAEVIFAHYDVGRRPTGEEKALRRPRTLPPKCGATKQALAVPACAVGNDWLTYP